MKDRDFHLEKMHSMTPATPFERMKMETMAGRAMLMRADANELKGLANASSADGLAPDDSTGPLLVHEDMLRDIFATLKAIDEILARVPADRLEPYR